MSEPVKRGRSGIGCPRCGGVVWKVTKTRSIPGRLVRLRTCKGCFLRVRTREVMEATIGQDKCRQ
ncbi:unnamed protein product [Gemmata massiliana]|uniref:Uncharacterized protein n=1 Tax=Gemmata massiliana TaxID=1210884 RepID=A0A6P2CXD2_9BACT|nr:hypothetical protein [Gemmata massiliana]VTR92805.1 unnamed protein product [Gemmata massiliana]